MIHSDDKFKIEEVTYVNKITNKSYKKYSIKIKEKYLWFTYYTDYKYSIDMNSSMKATYNSRKKAQKKIEKLKKRYIKRFFKPKSKKLIN